MIIIDGDAVCLCPLIFPINENEWYIAFNDFIQMSIVTTVCRLLIATDKKMASARLAQ